MAKRSDSIYLQGKRVKTWLKIKNLMDDDFVICGFIYKENRIISLVLGQYLNGQLIYEGHVTLWRGRQAVSENTKSQTPGISALR